MGSSSLHGRFWCWRPSFIPVVIQSTQRTMSSITVIYESLHFHWSPHHSLFYYPQPQPTMTGSPNPITEDVTLDDPTQSFRSARHRHGAMTNSNTNGQQQAMAWDVPPLVASPNGGSNTVWMTRSCKIITPQRLAAILLLSDHDDEEEQFQHQDSSLLESELSENEDNDRDHDSPAPLMRRDSFSSPPNDGPVVGGTTFPLHSLSTRKLISSSVLRCSRRASISDR